MKDLKCFLWHLKPAAPRKCNFISDPVVNVRLFGTSRWSRVHEFLHVSKRMSFIQVKINEHITSLQCILSSEVSVNVPVVEFKPQQLCDGCHVYDHVQMLVSSSSSSMWWDQHSVIWTVVTVWVYSENGTEWGNNLIGGKKKKKILIFDFIDFLFMRKIDIELSKNLTGRKTTSRSKGFRFPP